MYIIVNTTHKGDKQG